MALAVALAFLTLSRVFQLRIFQSGVAVADTAHAPPARDARSSTGYFAGQRNQILQPGDSYHWVMQTQQMIANDALRVRSVDYDNAPEGREVHWSGSMHWWLATVSWIESKFTGEPRAIATERAAVYAGMLILPLLLIGIVPVVARRFGGWPASLLAAGMTTVSAFRAEFGVAVLDHHGVVCACALMAVLFVAAGAAGWTRGEKREGPFVAWLPTAVSAKRWIIASSVAGATGLWISAATIVPVLGGIGLGAFIGMMLARPGDPAKTAVRHLPGLWRWWGGVGAGASLLFNALEYFPGPFPLRLEANHPLYSLAWLAAGDLLARVGEAGQTAESAPRPRQRFLFVLSALGAVAPLVVIAILRERVFAVADPVFWRYRDFISEFGSVLATLQKAPPDMAVTFLLRDVTVLPLLVIPAAVWLRKRLPPAARALILVAICPAILATLLGFQQVRWLNLSGALWIAAVVVFGQLRLSLVHLHPWRGFELPFLAIFLGAAFLPFPFDTVAKIVRRAELRSPPPADLVRTFVGRNFAHWLRHRVGETPVTVASAAATATDLIYFGGFKGLGTFYWENRSGLHAAVELHTAKTPEAAYAILQRHGVTHWVIFSWDDFPILSAGLENTTDRPGASGASSFILDILRGKRPSPAWMQPLPYVMPFRDRLPNDWVLAFEIMRPPQPSGAIVDTVKPGLDENEFSTNMGNAPK
jgi:hypothetical protein